MNYIHEIKKGDITVGIEVKISAHIVTSELTFVVSDVLTRPKRARNWKTSLARTLRNDYEYREVNTHGTQEEIEKYVKDKMLALVTEDEMKEAIRQAYDRIKPNTNKFRCSVH